MQTKTPEQIKLYKKLYYLHNKQKLCEYSKNYYTYQKCKGDIDNDQINVQMKEFLRNYKKNNNNKNKSNIINVKIEKEFTTLKFD
tara:strand:- start:504 stop:758 length:255 start_codon:yes stop_codon:yes gene_type:complete